MQLQIKIDTKFYTKNPESTVLGKKIVSKSIEMINDLGFESFTFKKLGLKIGSNESSIYRYFESKHALLVYLINWYWSWIEYKLMFATLNIPSAKDRLKASLKLLTQEVKEDNSFSYINEILLSKIIISESSKAYHTKDIDLENEKGYYKTYKQVVKQVSDIVLEMNPRYEYSRMLISTVIEGAHQQHYFAKHLPSLTDLNEDNNKVVSFYTDLVFKTIEL